MDENKTNTNSGEGNLSAKIEAILFVHGEPISLERLAEVVQAEVEEVKQALAVYAERARAEGRGVALINDGRRAQLVTSPVAARAVADLVKSELAEELTPAALETLSIVAYLGPVARHRIDYLRGVNSTFTLRNLMVRGLVERVPDPERGNVQMYQLAFNTLSHLGASRLEDLPNYAEIQASLVASAESETKVGAGPEKGMNS